MAAGITLNRNRQVPAEETPAFGGIAERFRRAGDLDRAVALCRDGLKRFPDHLSARVTLGWSLLDLGKYDEARVELEQALKRAPDNLAAIRGLAELHDRAEHTMLLPMDGPGQWPPDAETIDALEPGAAANDSLDLVLDPPPAAAEPMRAADSVELAQEPEPDLAEFLAAVPATVTAEPVQAPPPPEMQKPARKGKAGKRASARSRRREHREQVGKAPVVAEAPLAVSLKGGPKTFDVADLVNVEIPDTPKAPPVNAAKVVEPLPVAQTPITPPAAPVAQAPMAPPVAPLAQAPADVRTPEPANPGTDPVSAPDLEAAIRDLAPIEDTITPPVVDLADASALSLDDIAKDLGGAEAFDAAQARPAELNELSEPLFGPGAPDALDLNAIIAEVNSLDPAPVALAPEPVVDLAAEPDIPSGPVFELTNPTPEDFPLPVEDDEEELAAVARGLSWNRNDFYEVLLLDAIVEDVPAGPVLELTNPTIDDFPAPVDPDDLAGSDVLDGFEEVKRDFPLIDLLASLPEVEPEVIQAPPPVPPSLLALERFLRQVENRRLTLMSESRA